MLNKVIQREADILAERDRIKRGVDNIILLKTKIKSCATKNNLPKEKKRTWVRKTRF